MKKSYLYNQKNKNDLLIDINNESFKRITCSFYKYVKIENTNKLRDQLFIEWNALQILGRIYIANEGINAQMSIPEHNFDRFKSILFSYKFFKDIFIKTAIVEGISFLKLTIKIKDEIVAYKIPKDEYNINNVGKHLNYQEYHDAIDKGATIVDMRNYYEGEVGKFQNAIIPDVDTSRHLLPEIKKLLKGQKNNKILLYCTGGIRCEKASAYLIHHGFNDVNQLHGGIIQYTHDIKKNNTKSKFIGKNFVFDHRLSERVTEDVISQCHQCNARSDSHTNCLNQSCHVLFIQCKSCIKTYQNCCSEKCMEFNKLTVKEQKALFKSGKITFTSQESERIKPKLN